jgi:hypothetical protein
MVMARSLFGIETTDVNETAFPAARADTRFSAWRVVARPIGSVAGHLG